MSGKVYKNWSLYPMSEWRWPAFSPQEMASRGDGELLIDPVAMDRLQALRIKLGKPLIINSAYRSEAHNRRLKGNKNSQHRLAKAFDVRMDNHNPQAFERAARECGFTGFGHYPKSGFMHIDIGPARRWNDGSWFPSAGATPSFQPEAKPATLVTELMKPEVLMSGGSILTGATAVAQGSGPVQFALAAVLVVAALVVGAIIIKRVFGGKRD